MRMRMTVLSALLLFLVLSPGTPLWSQTDSPRPAGEAAEEAQPAAAPPASEAMEQSPGTEVTREPTGSPAEALYEPVEEESGGAAGEAGSAPAGAVQDRRGGLRETLEPMWQRFATGIPMVLKAVALLLLFWLVAILAGAGVRKLLNMTDVDNRAVRDWGLEGMLKAGREKPLSIEHLAGTAVKWVVLLFGIVAFFQTLDLSMVAGPLQNVLQSIMGVIPSLLQAAVILIAYWIVATLVKFGVTKLLEAVKFDDRTSKMIPPREVKGQMVGPSAMVGKLLFYVILLLGLPPFLDALGQRTLAAPLSDMLQKALGFIPNIVAALILLVVGRIIATIFREVVSSALSAAGIDAGAEKLGVSKAIDRRKVSDIAGAVAYFVIIIPVIIAAVDALQIKVISDPVKATLEQLLAAVPLIFVATVLLAIGYFVAKLVREIVEQFLSRVGFDDLPSKFGLDFLKPGEGQTALSSICGIVVMLVIMLLTVEQALATLSLDRLAGLVGALIAYLPTLVAGLFVILVALSLGGYVGKLIEAAGKGTEQGRILALIGRYAVILLGFSIGLSQLGVGERIVTVAVAAVLGGAGLAFGLAFGLGGRDRAKEVIEKIRAEM